MTLKRENGLTDDSFILHHILNMGIVIISSPPYPLLTNHFFALNRDQVVGYI